MTSVFNTNNGHVIIITGKIPEDLKAASLALAYFVELGCEVQSSSLHESAFLYTLVNSSRFYVGRNRISDELQQTTKSDAFSMTIA
jgi:hypothetical protein